MRVHEISPRRRLGRARRRRALARSAQASRPLRVEVGATRARPGWVATQMDTLDLLRESDWRRCFREESIDAILAEHVWEHLTLEEGFLAAARCRRYLRPGGYLRLAVPDGFHPSESYIDWVRPGGSGAGAGEHRVLYTYRELTAVLEPAGLTVQLLEYFDESGAFHEAAWDPSDGMVQRSRRFDRRNKENELRYTSLIVDAFRGEAS